MNSANFEVLEPHFHWRALMQLKSHQTVTMKSRGIAICDIGHQNIVEPMSHARSASFDAIVVPFAGMDRLAKNFVGRKLRDDAFSRWRKFHLLAARTHQFSTETFIEHARVIILRVKVRLKTCKVVLSSNPTTSIMNPAIAACQFDLASKVEILRHIASPYEIRARSQRMFRCRLTDDASILNAPI